MSSPTYRLDEITRLTGCTPRTIRYYIEVGLLVGPEQRGVLTAYSHENLVRIKAIRHLRTAEHLRLDAIKRRFAKMSLEQIEALLPAPPAAEAAPAPAMAPAPAAAPVLPYSYARWDYIELIPGLELRVRSDAGPVLRRLAHEIHAQFGAAARGEETALTSGEEARTTAPRSEAR